MKRNPRKGYVYCLQAATLDALIKIGFATHPPTRFNRLRTMSPAKLNLVGIWEGTENTEGHFHSLFHYLRQHGEWFNPEPDLVKCINAKTAAFKSEVEKELRRSQKARAKRQNEDELAKLKEASCYLAELSEAKIILSYRDQYIAEHGPIVIPEYQRVWDSTVAEYECEAPSCSKMTGDIWEHGQSGDEIKACSAECAREAYMAHS